VGLVCGAGSFLVSYRVGAQPAGREAARAPGGGQAKK
jgi:hypothetical protein